MSLPTNCWCWCHRDEMKSCEWFFCQARYTVLRWLAQVNGAPGNYLIPGNWLTDRLLLLMESQKYNGYLLCWIYLGKHGNIFLETKMAQVVEMLPLGRQGPVCADTVNIIAADGLATQGARASTAMVLIYFAKNILVSVPQGLFIRVAFLHINFISQWLQTIYPKHTGFLIIPSPRLSCLGKGLLTFHRTRQVQNLLDRQLRDLVSDPVPTI